MFHFPPQQFIDCRESVGSRQAAGLSNSAVFVPKQPTKIHSCVGFFRQQKKNQILDLILLTDNKHIYLWLPECLRKITGRKLFSFTALYPKLLFPFFFLLFQISFQMHCKAPFMHDIFSAFPLLLSSSLCSACPQSQSLYNRSLNLFILWFWDSENACAQNRRHHFSNCLKTFVILTMLHREVTLTSFVSNAFQLCPYQDYS